MILIFTPNPALERVALVAQFTPGASQKPMRVTTFAGGPGLRAANVVRLLGGEPFALGFVGGQLGKLLRESLERQNIPHALVPIALETRGDFLLLDREQGVMNAIPEEPPHPSHADIEKLLNALRTRIHEASLLVVSDDQPERDEDLFAAAIAEAHSAQRPVFADLRGKSLERAIAAGLFFVRVNLKTLQERTTQSLMHDSAIIAEARRIVEQGVDNVCVTLAEEGALLIDKEAAWRVRAPVVSHFNPTGSGETLVGAVAMHWETGRDMVGAVRYGCAAASVNVTHDEPGYATPGEVRVLLPRTTVEKVILR